MVEFEADDALATAAARWAEAPGVERTYICTPDKDLAQCVRTDRVAMRDRLRDRTFDEAGVAARWGVAPASIPDYLALVGDSADGFPGLPGWGAKSAAAVLARFGHLEAIAADPRVWHVAVRSPTVLNATLRAQWQDALLFRRLATLRVDVPLPQINPDELFWRGARRTAFTARCATNSASHVWRNGRISGRTSKARVSDAGAESSLAQHGQHGGVVGRRRSQAGPLLGRVGKVEPGLAVERSDSGAGSLGDEPGRGHVPGG